MDSKRYDRQIRVWGAEAQQRLQQSRVLLCGLKAVNVEIAKNLVLAGVTLTVVDDSAATESDLACNYFLAKEDVGKKLVDSCLGNIQSLNTHIQLEGISQSLESLSDEFIHKYDVVVYSGLDDDIALRLDHTCRRNRLRATTFFWTSSYGEVSLFFADFGNNFEYKDDPALSSNTNTNKEKEAVLRKISFPTIQDVLKKKWSEIPSRFFPLSTIFVKSRVINTLRKVELHERAEVMKTFLASNGYTMEDLPRLELDNWQSLDLVESSTNIMCCSILGSFLSQEIIKSISRVGAPGFNVFVFDNVDMSVKAIPIGAINLN